ncbi:hypothetical protein ACH4F6_17435 [Streptomyces sp. NPDC017936]|uniref:hypothetical protein n=1 Tax=Streptomyces sp. NPDC017936 TaxID=3365016 RepID=UPI0037AAD60B
MGTDTRRDERTITDPSAPHDPTPSGCSHTLPAPGELVLISGVGLGLEHVVRLGSFVVDHDPGRPAAPGKAVHARSGERLPARTLSGVDAVAVRPA